MRLDDFDFQLPPEQIAQSPLASRSASRMLVVDRRTGEFQDAKFTGLVGQLGPADVLVLNNTKVFPARLLGKLETGASIEILLIEEVEPRVWEAVRGPANALRRESESSLTKGCQLLCSKSLRAGGCDFALRPTVILTEK